MNRLVIASVVVLVVLVLSSFTYLSFYSGRLGRSSGESATSTVSSKSPGCGSAADWTTYHGNNSRTGYAKSSASSAAADWKSQGLDGQVYAEPVLCGEYLIVATENDTIYSLNATSGAMLWRSHVGTPMQGSALPCGNINPSGITGTPVVDPTTSLVYAVAFETPGVHLLVAIDVRDGGVRFSLPADPPGANPLVQQQRGALSLSEGRVYIPYGGLLGDCGDYHGLVVGLNADGSGGMISYQVPSVREAGIWAPSGAAVDSTGDLFVSTGNSASDSRFDYGNSVIELSPTLQAIGYFAPANWLQLNRGDTDLGSVGPMLLRDGEIFQIGKEGVGYLLNSTGLGGIGGQTYASSVCTSAFGGVAGSGNLVFVPCTNGLVALLLSRGSFQVLWRSPNFPAGPPIVTGSTVWTLDTSTGILHGYTATGVEAFTFGTGHVTRFTTPSFGDGRVFVAAGTQVFAFLIG